MVTHLMSEHSRGEEQVLADLLDLGYAYSSLADLRRSGIRYVSAIPVLVDALERETDDRDAEEIVRALGVPWAKPVAIPALIRFFRRASAPTNLGARWATGSALEIIWDDAYFDELVDLATDVRYGRGREMVVLGFAKSKRPEADQVLLGLLADRDVKGHAVSALRKRKVRLPASLLGGLLHDDRTWVRKEAQKVLE
ncbi:hypothetical protein JVX92_13350 [Microbacterium hominis]|uniref:HEAT repeat domain-containing protein n=1 Tax=Microbacterium hominis TaxID=162426 RepID=UPI00196639A9|nr:hypothetical protein [Microbacterium hominis]QRY40454.1 hypothetical protein JVX92_13350 [Microbacterium hominis]